MSDHDDVNNPKHYDLFPNQQVIDVIQASLTEEEFAGYCKGNALKYRLRAGDKGDALKCIAKANWYQNKLREVKETNAEVEWPDESRIDAIGQNGNDGAVYAVYSECTLEEVIGDTVLPEWARWVAVDGDGEAYAFSKKPVPIREYPVWDGVLDSNYEHLADLAPPFDFKNCIWEVNK